MSDNEIDFSSIMPYLLSTVLNSVAVVSPKEISENNLREWQHELFRKYGKTDLL